MFLMFCTFTVLIKLQYFFFKRILCVSCVVIEKLLQVCMDSRKLAFCAASTMGVMIWPNVVYTVYENSSLVWGVYRLLKIISLC